MKSTYLFLSLITAVLIVPSQVLAQGSSEESSDDSREEWIEQLTEEHWNQEYAHIYGPYHLESSEEECPDEYEEEIVCVDEAWDAYEDNLLDTLIDTQPKKFRKHKGPSKDTPRRFKESKERKHANAEKKDYGAVEEVKVEIEEVISGEVTVHMQKDKADHKQNHRVCKKKRKNCKISKPKLQIHPQPVQFTPTLVVTPIEPMLILIQYLNQARS